MTTPSKKSSANKSLSQFYIDDMPYAHAVWLTAHNAFSNYSDGWKLHYQQNLRIKEQFEYGVRSFMIDVHRHLRDLYLCHRDCFSTYGQRATFSFPKLLSTFLSEIKKLLNENPSEIITLHLEDHTGKSDKIMEVFKQEGLDKFLLTSNPNDLSLTLGKMRAFGARLVVFSDYQGERIKKPDGKFTVKNVIEGIFTTEHYKETIFGKTNFKECEERREDFRAEYDNPKVKLFVFNYFKTLSGYLIIKRNYDIINDYDEIKATLKPCILKGLIPNFVVVDFVELGNNGGAKAIIYELLSKGIGRDICYRKNEDN